MVAMVTLWLLQGKVIYPPDCANELGTSVRNFYKILVDVQQANLPIINVAGRWYIPADSRVAMGLLRKQDEQRGSK